MRLVYAACCASALSLLIGGCGAGGGGGGSSINPLGSGSGTGSGTGTLIPPPVATGNVATITLDAGPAALQAANIRAINMPYVSVTVCTPGTTGSTSACQTIDHVQVDTGSSGLRLLKSALSTNMNLPAVAETTSGKSIGECQVFGNGYTWGSVRMADIYIAGEIARSVPIQDIADLPGGASSIPASCSGSGKNWNSVASLGSNGILGVGLFPDDSGAYYTCNSSTCTMSAAAAAQGVRNPVASFQTDNNGVVIQFPSIASAGVSALTGLLYFGIGTQSNNALTSQTVYPTDAFGDITTKYPTTSPAISSFIDSGSNGLFFDSSLSVCSSGPWKDFYCQTAAGLTATNIANGGNPSGTINFSIIDASTLQSFIVAANIGAPAGGMGPLSSMFDWGLPFFFGRTVFFAIAGTNTPGTGFVGPYFAY